eukprot:7626599-Ditylum_brightwellii.AAC.1
MKHIASNINTLISITISIITGEGNTTATLKESPAKDIIDDNTNTTAASSQESTSASSSNQSDKPNETEETFTLAQQQKKSNALTKSALIQ